MQKEDNELRNDALRTAMKLNEFSGYFSFRFSTFCVSYSILKAKLTHFYHLEHDST